MLIIGDDIKKLHQLEDEFTQVSKMTSLGITSLYIGLEIIHLPKGIILHQ
jgi:hypothetical protein